MKNTSALSYLIYLLNSKCEMCTHMLMLEKQENSMKIGL